MLGKEKHSRWDLTIELGDKIIIVIVDMPQSWTSNNESVQISTNKSCSKSWIGNREDKLKD